MKYSVTLLSFILIGFFFSASTNIKHDTAPRFDIKNYTWLAGAWEGEIFGGDFEETWELPVDGTMMGMFRHSKDDKIVFYEFLLLDEHGMRLKHFNPDLTGWETKEDMVTFEMISFTKDKLEMKGLVFERKSDNELEVSLRLRQGEEVYTEVFTMRRK